MNSDIEEKLWNLAKQDARDAGFEFTVPCSTLVRDLVRAGVRHMRQSKRLGEGDFEEAARNLNRLVQAMVDETRRNTPASSWDVSHPLIREGAYVSAKKLCPTWPFT